MKLQVLRFSSQKDSTLGILYNITDKKEFLCFTIEDEYRKEKIKGKTRIPAGTYELILRTEGSFHQKYLKKYGSEFHKGMLWVTNVPNFEYILLHIGNDDSNTEGCLLLGDMIEQNITRKGYLSASEMAYKRVYPLIAKALLSGEKVTIEYLDFD
jgi:hypothetical protein